MAERSEFKFKMSSEYDYRFANLTGQKSLSSLLEELNNRPEGGAFLDIGLGNGYYAIQTACLYPKIQVYGLDIKIWNKYPGLTFVQGDVERLDLLLPRGFFDIATASNVARFLANPLALLSGGYQVLKPGGILLINMFPAQTIGLSQEIEKILKSKYGWTIVPRSGGYIDINVVKKVKELDIFATR